MSLGLRIAGFDIDLFKEENVVLNAVTKDLSDPSKVFSDYSQQFTVPASKNNNKVFRHFYLVDLDHGLDVRKTVDAELTVNSRFFRRGRIVMLGANMVNGKVNSYKVQFIGELSSLTGALGDKDIKDLDLSDTSFRYNRTNIALRFSQFYNNGEIIFTLLSSSFRYFWDSNTEVTERGEYKNLAIGLDYLALSPSVSIRYLFNKIAEKNNIEFKISEYLDNIFKGLYLFCDINKDGIEMNTIEMSWMPPDGTTIEDVFQKVEYGIGVKFSRIEVKMTINDDAKDFPYRIYGIDQRTQEIILPRSGEEFLKGDNNFVFNRNDGRNSIIFYVLSKYPMAYNSYCQWTEISATSHETIVVGSYFYIDSRDYDVTPYLPSISHIDFITSLIRMFNLVIIPDGNIYSFLTYNEWRDRGVVWDLSEFIDVGDYTINRQNLPEMFNFTFNENESFLMKEFRNRFSRSYGDLSYHINEKEIYTSESKELEISFDNAIFERVLDQENGNKTTVQVGFLEKEQKLIHYAVSVPLLDYPINLEGSAQDPWLVTDALIPTHVQSISNYKNSTVFGEEIEEYTGEKITNTLFKNHYMQDLKKMYNKNTRTINISAIVSSIILLNVKNEDKVFLNGSIYEIEKMNINLTTNKIDFDLSFYDKRV